MDKSETVGRLEAEHQEILRGMEELKTEFLKVVSEWLRPWYGAQARHVMEVDHETTLKLGREGVSALLREVALLQERTQEVVREVAGASSFWGHDEVRHVMPEEKKDFFCNPSGPGIPKIPWRQAVGIRYAAGRLWPILSAAGYLVRAPKGVEDLGGRWGNWAYRRQPPAVNDQPYYPGALWGLPPRIEELMARYEAMSRSGQEKLGVLAGRRHEDAKDAARKLLGET